MRHTLKRVPLFFIIQFFLKWKLRATSRLLVPPAHAIYYFDEIEITYYIIMINIIIGLTNWYSIKRGTLLWLKQKVNLYVKHAGMNRLNGWGNVQVVGSGTR